ncbi:MAG: metallophosphoesterase, partial [bacterium]
MKKYFVFSDVHGHYDELMRDLRLAGFDEKNEEHIIVSCGDNFDRGPKSFEMFVFLNEFPEHRK